MFCGWLAYVLQVKFLTNFLINHKDIISFHQKTKKKRFILFYGQYYHIPFRINLFQNKWFFLFGNAYKFFFMSCWAIL